MFFIFKKADEAPAEEIDPDKLYRVTTYDGRIYDNIPGAWVNSEDNDSVIYNGKYYYIDWNEVESIIPVAD